MVRVWWVGGFALHALGFEVREEFRDSRVCRP